MTLTLDTTHQNMSVEKLEQQSPTQDDEQQSPTLEDECQCPPVIPEEGRVDAWMTVVGVWLVLFATFGYAYSFGVYEDFYTRVYLSHHSPSKISWIGSFLLMIPSAIGILSGNLFDAGYFHVLEIVGSIIFALSLFLLSLAQPQAYSHVFLAQGLGMGVGMGLMFVPCLSVIAQHFRRKKALAAGIAMTGISVGAVVFPIMINNLIVSWGFVKTVRATAFIVLGMLLLGNSLMRSAYNKSGREIPKPNIKSLLVDIPYMLTAIGVAISLFVLYFPLFFLQLYAVEHGIDLKLAFYSIAILNASSAIGRIIGNYAADVYGIFNVLVVSTVMAGGSIFAMYGITNSGSLIAVAVLYGLIYGAWLSLAVVSFGSFAQNPSEVGARTGLGQAFSGLGLLFAAPVQGALLTSDFKWSRPIIFCGILMITSSLLFGAARMLLVKRRSTQKV